MNGYLRERGKDHWQIVLYAGRDKNGKPQQRVVTFKGTKREAQKRKAQLIAEYDRPAVAPERRTVGQYLEEWLTDWVQPNKSPRTYQAYRRVVNNQIVPHLGVLVLDRLTAPAITRAYREILEAGGRQGRPLSPKTVALVHKCLHKALEIAVKWKYLTKNPADKLDLPRAPRVQFPVLDEGQTRAFLAAVEDSFLGPPVLLAVTTGMRRGEILGLRWADIDWEQAAVFVRRALADKPGGVYFDDPKTAAGRRRVPLPEWAVVKLKAHQEQQAAWRRELGQYWQEHDLICPREDGRPWQPNTFSNRFKAVLQKLGLPLVRFHDLRHGHATHLLGLGVHTKVVSERLGHASTTITDQVYMHVLPGMQEEATRLLSERLRPEAKSDTVAEEDEQ